MPIPEQPGGQDSVDFSKLDNITFANRAPNAKDRGLFWVNDAGTAVTFYVRSKKSGTWFSI